MKPHPHRPPSSDKTLDRYATFLATPYTADDGKVRQPASTKFIKALRDVQAEHHAGRDLEACLLGQAAGFNGKVWFWSDLHLFHTNVIAYCDRPFATADEMNDTMLRNYKAIVRDEDVVVFGGDITMGGATATNELLRQLPGYKINILGNHDVERKGKRLHLAIDEVVAYLELTVGGQSILLTHYPVGELVLLPGQINIHGHIHTNALHPSLGSGARHINMSVENTGYSPVSLDKLLQSAGR